jgi:PAS domain S-box-containing protein
MFKYNGKRLGIKFREGGGKFVKGMNKTISGIAITSFSLLVIFIISIPFLLFPKGRKTKELYNFEGNVLLTLGEMISKLRMREEELARERKDEREKAEELRIISHVILNSLPFPILLLSPDKRILNMNRSSEEFFGRSFSSSLFLSASSILPSNFIEIIEYTEKKGFREERTINEDGKWFQIQVIPIKGEKGVIGTIFMLNDITERKREEEILKEKEKMASLGEMASYLAHEIKNSVGVAIGYLKLSGEKEIFREKVLKELNTITSNVERFLDFAKPLVVKRERIDLKESISEVAESFSGIEFLLEGEFPQSMGDKDLLKIVFINLIKNSIEAGCSKIEIRSYWKRGEKKIVIDFKDDGRGIPEDKIDKVFLPFFSTKEGGAGLGLSLSKKIILHHGGNIKIIPSKTGSTIRIELPVET